MLMLVAFAAGVANLWWMAALTAVMVLEKTGQGARRGVRPIGVGLLVLGLLIGSWPLAASGTARDGQPDHRSDGRRSYGCA